MCNAPAILANVGTPLMWASALHLVLGNFCIGILEGVLLSRVYRVRLERAIGLMILANYFSAWIGYQWLAYSLQDQRRFDLYNTWRFLWVMVAVAYAVTLVLEWPFVAACFVRKDRWFRRSCSASLLVQSVSYILLCGWYGLASGTSLYTRMSIVPIQQISLPADILVYYISADDGDVYRMELTTGRSEKVFDLNSTDLEDCLGFEIRRHKESCQEIMALVASNGSEDEKAIQVGVTIPKEACPQAVAGHEFRQNRRVYPGYSQAIRLGTVSASPWTFESGFWPNDGLRGENSRSGALLHFSLETPFVGWEVRRPILLPNDCVLFQLGPKQVCILEPASRKIALLTFGRGALAVLNSPPCLREPHSEGRIDDFRSVAD